MTGNKGGRRHALIAAVLAFGFPALAHAESESLIDKTLDTPDWLTVRGSHRTRFEVLHSPEALTLFARSAYQSPYYQPVEARAGNFFETTGLVSLQSTLFIEADLGSVRIGGELLDARSYFPVRASYSCDAFCSYPFATTNAVEPLQAYVVVELGNDSELTAGRFTMNLGSGRLVARSEFRNTLQSFHGIKAHFPVAENGRLSLFYTLPYSKRFEDDNEIRYDKPVAKFHFFGAHYENAGIMENVVAEAYVFGSIGRYSGNVARFPEQAQLTPGVRIYRAPKPGTIDFEVEAATQFSINTPNDSQFLGYFAHLEGGKTFDNLWSTRISLLLDVATGSDYEIEEELVTEASCAAIPQCVFLYGPGGLYQFPGDYVQFSLTASNPVEFNPLFGANDRDFGPEGLFSALPRRNIISPAIRFEAAPTSRTNFQVTYRPARHFAPDSKFITLWQTVNGPVPAYASGKHGWAHQLDARFDYRLFGEHVKFSLGAALFDSHQTLEGRSGLGQTQTARADASTAYYGYSSIHASF